MTIDKIYKAAGYANIVLFLSMLALTAYQLAILLRPRTARELALKINRRYKPGVLFGETYSLPRGLPVFDEPTFRKKLFSEETVQTAAGPKESSFILLGVSLGEKQIAILRERAQNKDYYCRPGDSIGDYTVKEIQKDRVILQSEKETVEITK